MIFADNSRVQRPCHKHGSDYINLPPKRALDTSTFRWFHTTQEIIYYTLNAPINCMPHLPLPGKWWGYSWDLAPPSNSLIQGQPLPSNPNLNIPVTRENTLQHNTFLVSDLYVYSRRCGQLTHPRGQIVGFSMRAA